MSRGRKLILIRDTFGIAAQEQKLLEEIGEFIELENPDYLTKNEPKRFKSGWDKVFI